MKLKYNQLRYNTNSANVKQCLREWHTVSDNWKGITVLSITLQTHFRNDVYFTCNLTETDRDHVNLSGVLTLKGKVFGVSGRFLLSDGTPVNGQIQLQPEGGSEPLIFKYQLQQQAAGYSLKATLLRTNSYGELEAHSTTRHKFDWDLHIQVNYLKQKRNI